MTSAKHKSSSTQDHDAIEASSGSRSSFARIDPRPVGWPKVAVLAILVGGALIGEMFGAPDVSKFLVGLSGIAIASNGIRRGNAQGR